MGDRTAIAWTDRTWNPWQGCTPVSPGCSHCYALDGMTRWGHDATTVRRSSRATFRAPLSRSWRSPARIFVCSWSDFFHEAADDWRAEAWEIIRQTPQHTYQILTKRPERVSRSVFRSLLPDDWGDGWPNVWLGTTVENKDQRWRLESLFYVPAVVRFISLEPLLGPVDLESYFMVGGFDWVISGGESGPHARPADLDWFRSIRDQCSEYGVPLFHKQNGGRARRKGEPAGGDLLDGERIHQWPCDQ